MKQNIPASIVDFDESPTFTRVIEAQNRAFVPSRFGGTSFPVKSHYHGEVELIWVRRGKGLWHIGQSVELFKDGDLLLIGSNLPHALDLAVEQDGNIDLHAIQF